jgi:hypothetical protein
MIISKHLASDLKIRRLFAKNKDIQKKLFGDIDLDDYLSKFYNFKFNEYCDTFVWGVYKDDDLCKIHNLKYVKDDQNFQNAKNV